MAKCKSLFVMTGLLAGLLLALPLANAPRAAWAETCARCGCDCGCHAICRPRCTTETETERQYGCECEDFCVPGSVRHEGCGDTCDGCDACDSGHCCTIFGVRIYTRKKLMVREVTREVPTTEYEVEYLCPRCAGCGGGCSGPGCSEPCDGGYEMLYPAAPAPGPAHGSPPPPPVLIDQEAAAPAPPAIPHPRPRATLLESLLERTR